MEHEVLGQAGHLMPARRAFQMSNNLTVANTSRRQYSAISSYRSSSINWFMSMPVTPCDLGESMPNTLQ